MSSRPCLLPARVPKPAHMGEAPGPSVRAKLWERLAALVCSQCRREGDRQWYGSLAASTLLHLALILWLSCLWMGTPGRSGHSVDSRWTPAQHDERLEIDVLQPLSYTTERQAGGTQAGGLVFRPDNKAAVSVAESAADTAVPELPTLSMLPSDDVAEESGAAAVADRLADRAGSGQGQGRGDGQGDGDGFFGIQAPGQRFVYVVDCSGSMNLPHDSEYKTRFKRLKFELIKSIGMMDPSMSFFVIFYNHNAIPMRASGLQPAVPRVQQHYLEWCVQRKAGGGTDPRDAMQMALRLQPDVIYFLTDGSFTHQVNEELKTLQQDRIAIHTFAFGDPEGEEILKLVAENNGGKYHFVP